MKTTKMLAILVLALGLMVCLPKVSEAGPLGTAFTYQASLSDAGSPADGVYDFEFELYDAPSDGNQVGSTVDIDELDVIDGYFTVELDFGSSVFDGNKRWLEVGVRPGLLADPNVYTTLPQRQPITACPYALQTRGIFVDDELNVGIGTTSPTGKLHVGTTPTYGDVMFFDAGSGLNDLSVDHGSAYTDNVDRIYFVEVAAEGSFVRPDTFKWSDDNGVTWSADINMIRGWYDLSHGVRIRWFNTFGHSDGGRLPGDTWAWAAFCSKENSLVVRDGKVGIGTASPVWELEVVNPTAGDGAESGVTANDAGGAVAAYSSTLGAPFAHYGGRVSLFSDAVTMGLDLRADGIGGDVRFYTGGPWLANERMRITDTGNIGIGTTSPEAKLHSVSTDMTKPGVYGENKSTGYGVYGKGAFTGVHGEGQRGIYAKSDTMFGIFSDAPKNYFSGNVGIGTASPETRLDISGDVRISGKLGIGKKSSGYQLEVKSAGYTDGMEVTSSGGNQLFRVRENSDGSGTLYGESLRLTGAYYGDIGPNNGAPFPRPAYDSGWVSISQGGRITLNHGIGGNADHYVVELWFGSGVSGIHQYRYGGAGGWGAWWQNLTNAQISVTRCSDDDTVDKFRVRIWVYN